MFHAGIELFEKFRVSVESEIGFTDFCKDLLFPYKHGIKFTSKALLFLDPRREHHDWHPSSTIEFIPWDNVRSIENVRGSRVTKRTTAPVFKKWLSTLQDSVIEYPYIFAEPGSIAIILQGVPRSERSAGGKKRMKLTAESLRSNRLLKNVLRSSEMPRQGVGQIWTDPKSRLVAHSGGSLFSWTSPGNSFSAPC